MREKNIRGGYLRGEERNRKQGNPVAYYRYRKTNLGKRLGGVREKRGPKSGKEGVARGRSSSSRPEPSEKKSGEIKSAKEEPKRKEVTSLFTGTKADTW